MPTRFSRLTVLIPVYNEAATIRTLLEAVLEAPVALDKENIVIDDGSTDGSGPNLAPLAPRHRTWCFSRTQRTGTRDSPCPGASRPPPAGSS